MGDASRDIVEGYLGYKLHRKGVVWRPPSSWRRERTRTSQRHQRDAQMAPPPVQVALRSAGDELEHSHHGDLSSHVSVLLSCRDDGSGDDQSGLRRSLEAVRDELFRDGVNWGRIVAMMELGGALSVKLAQTGRTPCVDVVARWMEDSLDSPPLRGWIEDSGGWNAFVELSGASRRPVRLWSVRTVVGLAALGAAGITLGALFSQK